MQDRQSDLVTILNWALLEFQKKHGKELNEEDQYYLDFAESQLIEEDFKRELKKEFNARFDRRMKQIKKEAKRREKEELEAIQKYGKEKYEQMKLEERNADIEYYFEWLKCVPTISREDKSQWGKIFKSQCRCGGTITAIRNTYNGHIKAVCDKCKITMRE